MYYQYFCKTVSKLKTWNALFEIRDELRVNSRPECYCYGFKSTERANNFTFFCNQLYTYHNGLTY